MISSLTLSVLCDNHAQRFFPAEWGFSLLLQGSCSVLLDCGSSDLFLRNARGLNLDLQAADACVLSHGHWDHGDGLAFLPARRLICHPEAFMKRYNGERYVGLAMTLAEAEEKFDLLLSRNPVWIDDDTVFLGEIPRRNDFEARTTVFSDAEGKPDFVMDDSAVAVRTEQGLVVVSGCAHAGICNTVAYAMEVTGLDRVYAVIGGFHLKDADDLTAETIAWLGRLDIAVIRASHCTGFRALAELAGELGGAPLASGEVMHLRCQSDAGRCGFSPGA